MGGWKKKRMTKSIKEHDKHPEDRMTKAEGEKERRYSVIQKAMGGRGERVRNREGKRECVSLEGLQSRKRPLLHGSTLMGLARPCFVHTVGQPLRIKITK